MYINFFKDINIANQIMALLLGLLHSLHRFHGFHGFRHVKDQRSNLQNC